jgi:hypothetical protein
MSDLTFSPENNRKKKDYSPMQQYILDNVVSLHNGNAYEAAKAAGYSNPRDAIKILKEELIEIAEQVLAESAIPSALALQEVVTSKEIIPNIKERIQAAKEILEHTNSKTTKIENTGNPIGLFILPPKAELTDA